MMGNKYESSLQRVIARFSLDTDAAYVLRGRLNDFIASAEHDNQKSVRLFLSGAAKTLSEPIDVSEYGDAYTKQVARCIERCATAYNLCEDAKQDLWLLILERMSRESYTNPYAFIERHAKRLAGCYTQEDVIIAVDDMRDPVQHSILVKELHNFLEAALCDVAPRSRDIISTLYGLDDGASTDKHTVADKWGIDTKYLSVLVYQAMWRIRRHSGWKEIQSWLEVLA